MTGNPKSYPARLAFSDADLSALATGRCPIEPVHHSLDGVDLVFAFGEAVAFFGIVLCFHGLAATVDLNRLLDLMSHGARGRDNDLFTDTLQQTGKTCV